MMDAPKVSLLLIELACVNGIKIGSTYVGMQFRVVPLAVSARLDQPREKPHVSRARTREN